LPSKDEHLKKAEGNEEFAASIAPDNQTRIDWTLVVLFYAAVHYVEAYLDKHLGQHLRSHTTRDKYMGRESNLRPIFAVYGHLKYFGYNARYELDAFTKQNIQEANGYLDQIKKHLAPLLK
jgi:hypothetical protein